MPYIYQEVEIDVELDMFDDDDLIEECKLRGLSISEGGIEHHNATDLINEIYHAKTLGKDYELMLRDLFYRTLGKIS